MSLDRRKKKFGFRNALVHKAQHAHWLGLYWKEQQGSFLLPQVVGSSEFLFPPNTDYHWAGASCSFCKLLVHRLLFSSPSTLTRR